MSSADCCLSRNTPPQGQTGLLYDWRARRVLTTNNEIKPYTSINPLHKMGSSYSILYPWGFLGDEPTFAFTGDCHHPCRSRQTLV